jgi:hypothetical protein
MAAALVSSLGNLKIRRARHKSHLLLSQRMEKSLDQGKKISIFLPADYSAGDSMKTVMLGI